MFFKNSANENAPRKLLWTKETPKEEGFYFYRDDDTMRPIVLVVGFIKENSFCFIPVSDPLKDHTNMNGKWAGPIREPGR